MKWKYKYRSLAYIVGLLLLLISVFNKICWIYVCVKYTEFEETKAAYLTLFPEFLANLFLLNSIDVIISGIAGFIFFKFKKAGCLKKTSMILMIISLLLCGWTVFSLM